MKKLYSLATLCILTILALTSCQVEKRLHKKGYHVTWNFHTFNKNVTTNLKSPKAAYFESNPNLDTTLVEFNFDSLNHHCDLPIFATKDTTLLPPRSAKKRAKQAEKTNSTKPIPERMKVFEGLTEQENKEAFALGKKVIRAGNYIRISIFGMIGSLYGIIIMLITSHPILLQVFAGTFGVFLIMTLAVNLAGRIGEESGIYFIKIFETNHKESQFYKRVFKHYKSCINGFFRGLCDFLWFIN